MRFRHAIQTVRFNIITYKNYNILYRTKKIHLFFSKINTENQFFFFNSYTPKKKLYKYLIKYQV